MTGRKELEKIFQRHSIGDFKWLDPRAIAVAQWVRMKCVFGCDNYGMSSCCPPNVPQVQECARFFGEYEDSVIFHFQRAVSDLKKRRAWYSMITKELLEVEREVFLAGYQKAFVLPMGSCNLCVDCAESRAECKHKDRARPTPEAFAVDVFSTARSVGYPIEVLKDRKDKMNRYALLLVE